MSRFTDYQAYINRGGGMMEWVVQLIDITGPSHIVRWSNNPVEAAAGGAKYWEPRFDSLSLQNTTISQRYATMRFPILAEDLPLVPHTAADPLHPSSQWKVRLWARMAGMTEVQKIATMLPDEVTVSDTSGGGLEVEVTLTDMMRPIRSKFFDIFKWDADIEIIDVVDRIIGSVMGRIGGPPAYAIFPTGFTTAAGSANPGDDRFQVCNQLLAGAGHELWVDAEGVVQNRAIPGTVCNEPERWRYNHIDGIPWHQVRQTTTPNSPIGVRVEAGSYQAGEPPIIWTVYDRDPNSQGYFQGSQDPDFPTLRLPWVHTLPQASAAGYANLRRIGTGPGIVKFTCLPNAYLQEADDVELIVPNLGIAGLYKVLGFQLPLHPDNRMEVTCRASWDPRAGTGDPNDPNANSIFSVSGVFTAGALPADWTVVSGSWTTVNQSAFQTSAGYGTALWNTPLVSSNQEATAYVSNPTSGHVIGVIVRSDGSMSGIVTVLQSDGKVLIQQYQGGALVTTLAQGQYAGTLSAGAILSVTADGNQITASVTGTQVVSATDPGTAGTMVGIVSEGGPLGSAPGVSSFSAATL